MSEGLAPNKTFPKNLIVRNCANRALRNYPVTDSVDGGRKYGIPVPGKKFRAPDEAPEPGNQLL